MEKLSVTIITKNEELNIKKTLESVLWADEILILDSGSTDRTLEICRSFNCKILQTSWMGFGQTKKFAVDNAQFDWILSIDADEVVSPELKVRIQAILSEPQYNGYKINFQSFYLDKKIKYSGWKNGYKLRLFNRKYGNFNERILHEYVQLDSPIGIIHEPIFHFSYRTIAKHFDKMNNYSDLAAIQKYEKKSNSTIIGSIVRGILQFIKM
ncbi:glycosyltransferase family 2 protein, partial [Bacteroidetes/Chlorobi group bacterium ChocPot_Mid]